jgi:formate hydrogenlyase subunit 3/multisubunit Na+/H+ antiporter MnhD subunit
MLPVLIGAACTCALISIVSFVLYARARMKEQESAEAFYQRIHYFSLFLLFALGVVIMFYMGEHSD